MASQTENLTTAQPGARKENARKSTGPRTAAGKKRSSQNSRKHGLYSHADFFSDAALALGEDERDFGRLLKGLVQARRPVDTLEMVLVEDIALIIWKKARLDRAEAAVQVCNLQKHDMERRKQFVQVGRDISDTLQSEVREKGLRTRLDAPGKFEQILSILDILVEMVEKNDFSPDMQEFLHGVYGEEPTLRGAGLYNNYFKLSEMKPGNQEFEDAKTLMRARLAEEISDVAQEYELFLHEHVENTRAARMAATAPSHAQWAAIIRQQNALHRQLQQKIRLLQEIQEKRKKEEERSLDKREAPLRRDPSDEPLGGEQASNRKKILNRGNEPKTLLKTNELAVTAPSKRSPFCPGKSAIKANKKHFKARNSGHGLSSRCQWPSLPKQPSGAPRHCLSTLAPVPKTVAGGTVQGLSGDLEMQEDLAAMVALVGERVTKKSHRAQLAAFDVSGAFRFGEKLTHGCAGVDKRLPQRRPGSRSARDFVKGLRQSRRAAFKPVEPRHMNVYKITCHRLTPRQDRRRELLVA